VHKTQNIKYTNIGFRSFSLAVNSVHGCEHIFQQGWLVVLPPKLSFEFPVPVRKNQLWCFIFLTDIEGKISIPLRFGFEVLIFNDRNSVGPNPRKSSIKLC